MDDETGEGGGGEKGRRMRGKKKREWVGNRKRK